MIDASGVEASIFVSTMVRICLDNMYSSASNHFDKIPLQFQVASHSLLGDGSAVVGITFFEGIPFGLIFAVIGLPLEEKVVVVIAEDDSPPTAPAEVWDVTPTSSKLNSDVDARELSGRSLVITLIL